MMLVKGSVGRNRTGCGAVREGKKGTVVVWPRTPGCWVTTLTLTAVLLLPASEQCLHTFGTERSGWAITQVLPVQKTEQGKEIRGNTHTPVDGTRVEMSIMSSWGPETVRGD